MNGTTTPKDLLRKHGIRPLKRLGQCFLIDGNMIAKIAGSARVGKEDVVVEIGAGLGVMTALIAREAGRVIALEIDRVMIDILRAELQGLLNVEIVETDVLRYDFSSPPLGEGEKLKVIGNVPYHISSPILFHLLPFRDRIDSMVLMFQKEVAERITALPGTKAYGTLSVILSMYFDSSMEGTVPARCFFPVPKVDSAVLRMVARREPLIPLENQDFFQTLVRTAFGQRRKTLLNNLKRLWPAGPSEKEIAPVLERLGIDGGRRGETLSVEEFGRLSNALFLLKQFA